MSDKPTPPSLEQLQKLITRGPFNQWLNFTFIQADESGIEVKAGWREEWVVNPDRRYTHGGILAAIVDVVADYAIAAQLGRPVPTIDIRVDYHKAAMPGDLTAKGRVVRSGSQYSTAPRLLFRSPVRRPGVPFGNRVMVVPNQSRPALCAATADCGRMCA